MIDSAGMFNAIIVDRNTKRNTSETHETKTKRRLGKHKRTPNWKHHRIYFSENCHLQS